MVGRSIGRFLAPIALAATIAGTYVIVHRGLAHKHPATQLPATTATRRAHRHVTRSKFYRVQQGDNLTSIARTTGIPITRIEALNPKVDPNSLQTGERLRLRR